MDHGVPVGPVGTDRCRPHGNSRSPASSATSRIVEPVDHARQSPVRRREPRVDRCRRQHAVHEDARHDRTVRQSYGLFDRGTIAGFIRPSYDSATGHFHVRYTHLGTRFGDNANVIGFIQDDNRRELDSALEKTIFRRSGPLERLRYTSNYNVYWGQDRSLRSWQIDQTLFADWRNRLSATLDFQEEFKRFEKDFRNRQAGVEIGFNTRQYQSIRAATRRPELRRLRPVPARGRRSPRYQPSTTAAAVPRSRP